MPDAPAYTYGVNDLLGIADGVNFKCLSCGSTDAFKNAVPKAGDGEYVGAAEKSYDEKLDIKAEYQAIKLGALTFPDAFKLGAAFNNYVVTQVQLSTSNSGHLKMSVTAHKHPAGTHNPNTFAVTFPACTGYGAVDFLSTGNDGAQTSTWGATVDHLDKIKGNGDFLCGRSQGCKIEASVEYISDTVPVLADGWNKDSSDVKTGADFYTASLKAHRYQTPDVA